MIRPPATITGNLTLQDRWYPLPTPKITPSARYDYRHPKQNHRSPRHECPCRCAIHSQTMRRTHIVERTADLRIAWAGPLPTPLLGNQRYIQVVVHPAAVPMWMQCAMRDRARARVDLCTAEAADVRERPDRTACAQVDPAIGGTWHGVAWNGVAWHTTDDVPATVRARQCLAMNGARCTSHRPHARACMRACEHLVGTESCSSTLRSSCRSRACHFPT